MIRQAITITAALLIAVLPSQVMADKKHPPKLSCKDHKLTLEVWSQHPSASNFTTFECSVEKHAKCTAKIHFGDSYVGKKAGYLSNTINLGPKVKRVTVGIYSSGTAAHKGKPIVYHLGKVKTRCKK